MSEGFADTFDSVEGMDYCQNMSGVCALSSSLFEIALLTQQRHERLEEELVALLREQTGAKLGKHCMIEASITQLQP